MKTLGIFGGLLVLAIGVFALVPNNDEGMTVEVQVDSTEISSSSDTISQETNRKFPPNFTLKDLEGNKISLADYRGKKAVVIDFWASWCPNCRRDMPVMQRLYEKYGDQVEVIAVNLQESSRTVEKFVNSEGFTFLILLDPAGSASRAYGVNYTNFHVLIDKDGYLLKTVPGDISESDFRSLII